MLAVLAAASALAAQSPGPDHTPSTGGRTPSGLHLITDSIEAPRLEKEQKLKEQGWEFHIHLWHEQQELISRLVGGLKLGADLPYPAAVDLSGELSRLRGRLTPEEGERFRDLGGR